jgi:integrase
VTNLPGRHFKSICRRAESPTIGLHDLRHTCATILVVARKYPEHVQELLRPRSTKTSRSTRTRASSREMDGGLADAMDEAL